MPRFALVPAAYVLFLAGEGSDTRILLQLRQGDVDMSGHWACAAAGHVDPGESPAAAACREAREELGVEVMPDDLVAAGTVLRRRGDPPVDQRVDFFYTSRRWSGEPRIMEPDKCGGLDWFPVERLPQPLVPHELRVIEAVAAGALPAISAFGV